MMCGGHRERLIITFQKFLSERVNLIPFQYFKELDIECGSVNTSMIQIKIEPSKN